MSSFPPYLKQYFPKLLSARLIVIIFKQLNLSFSSHWFYLQLWREINHLSYCMFAEHVSSDCQNWLLNRFSYFLYSQHILSHVSGCNTFCVHSIYTFSNFNVIFSHDLKNIFSIFLEIGFLQTGFWPKHLSHSLGRSN